MRGASNDPSIPPRRDNDSLTVLVFMPHCDVRFLLLDTPLLPAKA
jgi:hypothetical protein